MTTNYYTDSNKTNTDSHLDMEGFDSDALRLLGGPTEDNSGWLALGLSPGEYDLEALQ